MSKTHLRRRDFFSRSATGLSLLGLSPHAFAAGDGNGAARRCVVLWMNGGPSQFETFDPKPGTATGGPTQSISTSVPGVSIAEHLPKIAERLNRLTIIRNLTSSEGAHERAQYYLHTGYQMVPAFPRPAIGSMVSHELPPADTPKYVLLGGRTFGPAYCGPEHAAFAIDDANAARQLIDQIERRQEALSFLSKLSEQFDRQNNVPDVARRRSMLSQVQRIVTTPFGEALDSESETDATRERYGDHAFGRRCLLARRLLQRDVPFVEVQLDGWDTHTDNFNQVSRLASALDQAWSALIDDLVTSGLWEDTLLVWMGEFGRTPTINGQRGRDHFPAVTPVVLGGGTIRAGHVVGATDRAGSAIEGPSFKVADLSATILDRLGVEPNREFQTSFDSPTTATDDGNVISEVLS